MQSFTEKDILTDLLLGTKSLSNSYHNGVLEAANNRIRNTFIQLNNDTLNFQKQLFDIMHDKGFYQVEPARTAAAAQTYQPGAPEQMSVRSDYGIQQRPY